MKTLPFGHYQLGDYATDEINWSDDDVEWCNLKNSPLSEFAFNTEVTIQEVLDTPDNASVGYFVEVDLSYPLRLHDDRRDFPWPLPRTSLKRSGWESTKLS